MASVVPDGMLSRGRREEVSPMDWVSLLHNPIVIVFLVPIVAIIVTGVVSIVKMVIAHRERMAMIEQGMDPDRKRPEEPEDD